MFNDEISVLRKNGELDDALFVCKLLLEYRFGSSSEKCPFPEVINSSFLNYPDEKQVKFEMSWVLYDMLKVSVKHNNTDKYWGCIEQISNLKLDKTNHIFFDNLAWQIARMNFRFARNVSEGAELILDTFEIIQPFQFNRPSASYSALLKSFLSGLKKRKEILAILDWWGFDNLRPQDYLATGPEEIVKYPSLAEQAFKSYAKAVYFAQMNRGSGNNFEKQKANIIDKLQTTIQNHPEIHVASYHLSKILTANGEFEKAFNTFYPYMKNHTEDGWAWELMSDIKVQDIDFSVSCLCRAVLCKNMPAMTVNIKRKLAKYLIKTEQYDLASAEVLALKNIRSDFNIKSTPEEVQWRNEPWFNPDIPISVSRSFYLTKRAPADMLFNESPNEVLIIVTFINRNKKQLQFISEKEDYGYFKYDRFLVNVNEGDVLKVQLHHGEQGGRFFINSARIVEDDNFRSSYVRKVEGVIQKHENTDKYFINDIILSSRELKQMGLQVGEFFSGEAINSYYTKNKLVHCKFIR